MTDKLACPQCGQQIDSPDGAAGSPVECGSCGVSVSAGGTHGGGRNGRSKRRLPVAADAGDGEWQCF